MSKILIYHNPRWGKSRESVKILENSGYEYETIDYINSPPSQSELQTLADKMGIRAKDFIRSRESEFKELNLKAYIDDDTTLFKYMSENPKLIERPIVVRDNKAVLGRPPMKVEELLNLWTHVTVWNKGCYHFIFLFKLVLKLGEDYVQ